MTVEFWIGGEFDRTHERRAMSDFFQAMQARFEAHPGLYLVLANFYLGGNQIDYTVLKRNAVIVIDMKEYTVPIRATENGHWLTIPDEHPLSDEEPFKQVKKYRGNWIDYLKGHQDRFLPPGKGQSMNLEHVSACIAVSPTLHPHSRNEIPRKAVWFQLVGLDKLTDTIDQFASQELNFTDDELRTLVSKVMNLHRWLPQPVPASPPYNPFFGQFPIPRGFVDRKDECAKLGQCLIDKTAVVISLRGPGGIGKTELAAWFVGLAFSQGYRIKWVNCREKDVNLDGLLDAIADELQTTDLPKASFIRTSRATIEDRRAAAFGYLDGVPTFLVLKDYDAVVNPRPLDGFFTYAVHHSNNLRILLTTRKPLECLDDPAWPPCVACEVKLGGLPLEVVPDVLDAKDMAQLADSTCEEIWRQTLGNPYLMRMVARVTSVTGGKFDISHALDNKYLKEWFDKLMETLSEQARQLAYDLSVIRAKLDPELIRQVSGLSDTQADQLRQELIEQLILRENGGETGGVVMYDLIREFLLVKIAPKVKRNAHNAAGKYFERLAADKKDERRRIEYLFESLYHFVQAPHPDKVLQLSDETYASLIKRGFWGDARRVAADALAAARTKENRDQIRHWLLALAESRIGYGEFSEVANLLEEAEKCLPRVEKKATPKQLTERHRLRMPILIQKGRLAYHQGEKHYELAREHFTEALALAQKIGNPAAEADCLIRIGQVERRLGRYPEAQNYFLQAYETAQGLQERQMEFECAIHLGKIAREQCRLNEAYEQYQKAYTIAQKLKDQLAEEMTLSEAGRLAAQSAKLPLARSLLEKALKIANEIGNTKGIRIELTRLIDVLIALQDYAKAKEMLEASEDLHRKADDEIGNAWNLKYRGQLEKAQAHTEQGNQLIQQGIQRLVAMGLGNMEWIHEFEVALKS